jgi:hypothetical protein
VKFGLYKIPVFIVYNLYKMETIIKEYFQIYA